MHHMIDNDNDDFVLCSTIVHTKGQIYTHKIADGMHFIVFDHIDDLQSLRSAIDCTCKKEDSTHHTSFQEKQHSTEESWDTLNQRLKSLIQTIDLSNPSKEFESLSQLVHQHPSNPRFLEKQIIEDAFWSLIDKKMEYAWKFVQQFIPSTLHPRVNDYVEQIERSLHVKGRTKLATRLHRSPFYDKLFRLQHGHSLLMEFSKISSVDLSHSYSLRLLDPTESLAVLYVLGLDFQFVNDSDGSKKQWFDDLKRQVFDYDNQNTSFYLKDGQFNMKVASKWFMRSSFAHHQTFRSLNDADDEAQSQKTFNSKIARSSNEPRIENKQPSRKTFASRSSTRLTFLDSIQQQQLGRRNTSIQN